MAFQFVLKLITLNSITTADMCCLCGSGVFCYLLWHWTL